MALKHRHMQICIMEDISMIILLVRNVARLVLSHFGVNSHMHVHHLIIQHQMTGSSMHLVH